MQLPESLNLHVEGQLSAADASRQHQSARLILDRFVEQPGVVLGDEVGMGKTFVALAVASAHVVHNPKKPVVIMVPRSVVGKWKRDSETFRVACLRSERDRALIRVRTAETGVDFLKLLDDSSSTSATIIVLAHGALSRRLADKWVKLAVLQAAIKGRHGVAALRQRLARFAPMVLRLANVAGKHYDLFLTLLETPADQWKRVLVDEGWLCETDDDPVPKVFLNTLADIDLNDVFERLVDFIPTRTSGDLKGRIKKTRNVLDGADGGVLPPIWKATLKSMRLALPLLVLDEAHRVRNAGTQLAALLAATREDLDAAGGQLAERFDRMLFLTATPFQLGHNELKNVLLRFDAVNWRSRKPPNMSQKMFRECIESLHSQLDSMQLDTDSLERSWKRLVATDIEEANRSYGSNWWAKWTDANDPECLTVGNERLRAVMRSFWKAQASIKGAELQLKPWILRNSRSAFLPSPHDQVPRRVRIEGAAVLCDDEKSAGSIEDAAGGGLRVSSHNALPFLLAARLTTLPDCRKVFAEGIASSYEALLNTRREDVVEICADDTPITTETSRGLWYASRLREAALAMGSLGRDRHPKVKATVDLAMALWRKGEKVLIFCHYRQTGSALHRYLSEAMLKEIEDRACAQFRCAPQEALAELRRLADRLDRDRPAARAVIALLEQMIDQYEVLRKLDVRTKIHEIVLRFLRTPTFLVRFADLNVPGSDDDWILKSFDREDASGMSLRSVIRQFLDFLATRSGEANRAEYLGALLKLQTGTHAGPEIEQSLDDDEAETDERTRRVANVKRVYGDTRDDTRQRITLTFNTPFYPEILISSSVMAEGVDLHLNCRHVIHHDLDWNPSSLEQRTGRIDRLGAKGERSGKSIRVYLPYVEGCQDEKLFRVVMDREKWFSVVMGGEESMARILRSSPWEIERLATAPLVPDAMIDRLRLNLSPLQIGAY